MMAKNQTNKGSNFMNVDESLDKEKSKWASFYRARKSVVIGGRREDGGEKTLSYHILYIAQSRRIFGYYYFKLNFT